MLNALFIKVLVWFEVAARWWAVFLAFMRPFCLYLAGACAAALATPYVDQQKQLWPSVLLAGLLYLAVRFVWRFFP